MSMTKEELLEQYTVEGFSFNLCFVTRKADGVKGTLDFDHEPRVYYGFVEDAS